MVHVPSMRELAMNSSDVLNTATKTLQYYHSSDVSAPPDKHQTADAVSCMCSWKHCQRYQDMFRTVNHNVYDGFVVIKISHDHPASMEYKACLERTLGSQDSSSCTECKSACSSVSYSKYVIAKHHFTKQHLAKYKADPKQYSFIKPFSLHGAKKYLFTVSAKEVFQISSAENHVHPTQALYFQCPNVPHDVVKMEYLRVLQEYNQSQAKSSISTKKKSDMRKEKSFVASNKCYSLEGQRESDANTDASSISIATETEFVPSQMIQLHSIESENRLLKDQLDFMKVQFNHLNEIVEQLRSSSALSKNSFGSTASHMIDAGSGGKKKCKLRGTAVKKKSDSRMLMDTLPLMPTQHHNNVTSSSNCISQDNEKVLNQLTNASHPRNTRSANYGNTGNGGCRNQLKYSVPDEIDLNDGDDNTEARTQVSQWTEETDLYGSIIDDDLTAWTNGTFHSKYKQQLVSAFATTIDIDGNEDDEEEKVDEYDLSCVSGVSTLVSVTKSIITIQRELDTHDDYNDGESDDDSLDDETLKSRSLASSSYQVSTLASDGSQTFGRNIALYNQQHLQMPVTTPKQLNKSALRRPSRSRPVEESPLSSSSVVNDTSVTENSRPALTTNSSTRTSVDSRNSRRSTPKSNSSDTSEVRFLNVTDPYGERGTYTGAICKATGLPHGYGRLEYDQAGRWYEGDWKHGRWTGHGTLSNGEGDYYTGSLKKDQKHGHGIMKFRDGRVFEGHYVMGMMKKGIMTFPDGSTYEGTWSDGMRHGIGRCWFVDGTTYVGEFKHGHFYGLGKMTWADNGYYEGDWVNGQMHGKGYEVRPNGTLRHDGLWRNGRPVR